MKISLESGERLLIEVPAQTASCAQVSVQAAARPPIYPPRKLVDVVIEDGLIGKVEEHVCHRHPIASVEDRLTLWAHLVSEHATCIGLDMPIADLIEIHEREHDGPGTIRNHPREQRTANIATLVAVLAEADNGLAMMDDHKFRMHVKHIEREIERRIHRKL